MEAITEDKGIVSTSLLMDFVQQPVDIVFRELVRATIPRGWVALVGHNLQSESRTTVSL